MKTQSRVTLYSSSGVGAANNCRVPFSCDLPPSETGYQLVVESFATTVANTPYAVTASGIFYQPAWDSAIRDERITLLTSSTNQYVNSVASSSVGFQLGPVLKGQTLTVQIYDTSGTTLSASFPAWIMTVVLMPL